jgi:excisionase family DNA binding protein
VISSPRCERTQSRLPRGPRGHQQDGRPDDVGSPTEADAPKVPDAVECGQIVPVLSPLPLLTVRETAARLRVCPTLVYRACERGELRYARVGSAIRIGEADLDSFIAGRAP